MLERTEPPSMATLGEARRAIEAMLLVATDPTPVQLLAQLVELPVDDVQAMCQELAGEYEDQRRGFQLVEVAGGWRYQTHPDTHPYVERYALQGIPNRLSSAALETLAIVAYKQPISRAQIGAIRGVNVDGVLRTLVQRGYVTELGRDDGPGQATLFGTTPFFLEQLGLMSTEDLPALGDFVPSAQVLEALEETLKVGDGVPPEPSIDHDGHDEAASGPGALDLTDQGEATPEVGGEVEPEPEVEPELAAVADEVGPEPEVGDEPEPELVAEAGEPDVADEVEPEPAAEAGELGVADEDVPAVEAVEPDVADEVGPEPVTAADEPDVADEVGPELVAVADEPDVADEFEPPPRSDPLEASEVHPPTDGPGPPPVDHTVEGASDGRDDEEVVADREAKSAPGSITAGVPAVRDARFPGRDQVRGTESTGDPIIIDLRDAHSGDRTGPEPLASGNGVEAEGPAPSGAGPLGDPAQSENGGPATLVRPFDVNDDGQTDPHRGPGGPETGDP